MEWEEKRTSTQRESRSANGKGTHMQHIGKVDVRYSMDLIVAPPLGLGMDVRNANETGTDCTDSVSLPSIH
jgi:hypothetical protein